MNQNIVSTIPPIQIPPIIYNESKEEQQSYTPSVDSNSSTPPSPIVNNQSEIARDDLNNFNYYRVNHCISLRIIRLDLVMHQV